MCQEERLIIPDILPNEPLVKNGNLLCNAGKPDCFWRPIYLPVVTIVTSTLVLVSTGGMDDISVVCILSSSGAHSASSSGVHFLLYFLHCRQGMHGKS